MPTDAGTDTDAVRAEIDTTLDDPDIETILGRVEREIDRAYDEPGFQDTQHRQDFEAVLAALRLAEGQDRRAESVQSGRSRRTYEVSEINELRKRVRRDDPGDEFGHSGTIRQDSGRHVTSTGEN